MKELSIEEKAQRYDEALQRTRKWYDSNTDNEGFRGILEEIFPELAESYDERIRKAILGLTYIDGIEPILDKCSITRQDIRAWLEKQGEKDEEILILKDQIESLHAAIKAVKETHRIELEKQGEQKAVGKVEPKFKVGDWVIDWRGITDKITNVIENVTAHTYGYDTLNGEYFNDYTEDVRLWTIQDAKAGDLLADDYGIYIFDRFDEYDEKCFICMGAYQHSQKVYENEHMLCSVEVHPATKEQRDLLFQKMHEAGYEWSDKDRKLIKIVK